MTGVENMESLFLAWVLLASLGSSLFDLNENGPLMRRNQDLFCAQVSSVHTRIHEGAHEHAVTFISGHNVTLTSEGFKLAKEALTEGLFFCVSNTNPPIYSLSRSTNLR